MIIGLFFNSCKNTTEPNDESVTVEISMDKLSDQLGDKDGTASSEEKQYVLDYFNSNDQMWVITNCMNAEGETVKSQVVRENFSIYSDAYSSEENFRKENQGISIRTQWIGITVIEKNNKIFVTKTFRSPGPNYASAEWEKLKIIK
jgi:hypothetical protein